MSKRFIITIITLIIIGIFASVAIFFAKGYSFSAKERRIVGTGIMTVSSEPASASVYLDGHLTTATNATISSLSPKSYSVRVVKEGFIPWEKSVEVKEGLVTELKVTLFPSIPTIYPLTYTGVVNPLLSPDGERLVYIVPTNPAADARLARKSGIWVWTMSKNQPIAFARSAEPHQIATNSIIDFSQATLKWSADSKEVLATVGGNNFLLEADRLNPEPRDITATLDAILKGWEDDTRAKSEARILTIKDLTLKKIASDSTQVNWSPDETKMLVKKDNTIKVYDLEDQKNYDMPTAKAHIWLPDSGHVILVEDTTISIINYDGANKAVIYAGKFENSFVFPWPDASRIAIISSFPTPTASEPNLYGINLR